MEDLKKKKAKTKLVEKKISKSIQKKLIKNSSSKEATKTRPRKEKPIMDRPKYLNLKVLHDFDKVKEEKLFLDGKLPKPLTLKQRKMAKEEFTAIGKEYNQKIEHLAEKHSGRSENLQLAGGNFTYFFTIPKAAGWLRENFPHDKFEFKLFEGTDLESLKEQNADIILTGSNSGWPGFTDKELDEAGYKKLRFSCSDNMYWAASQGSIDHFGSKKAVLEKHDVIFSRRYIKDHIKDYSKELERPYPIIPEGRKGLPRIVTDQYFMEHVMAKQGLGITTIYDSMGDSHGLVILDDKPVATFERYVIVKKTLDEKYHAIARRLIYILQHKGENENE